MHKGERTPPAAYVIPGGTWPTSPLIPGAPPAAEYARRIVLNLTAAADLAGLTDHDMARRVGVSRTALTRVMRGDGLPSLTTIVALEHRLDADLYPGGADLRARLDAT